MTAALKLIHDEPAVVDILPFERRRSERHHTDGQVTALQRTADALRRITSLTLCDVSDTGLGAMCKEPIEVDCPITVVFQAHGPEGGHDAHGRVVRCEKTDNGHRVGIRFTNHRAA